MPYAQVCQDALMGDDMVRGISGSQKERVTIDLLRVARHLRST